MVAYMGNDTRDAYRVAFAGNKGGTGKSHGTIHLGVELAKDSEVLLIDADSRSKTTRKFSARRAQRHPGRAPVIVHMEGAELTSNIGSLSKKYDYILIDASGDDASGRRAMMTAHVVLAPVIPQAESADTLEETLLSYQDAKEFRPDLPLISYFTGTSTRRYPEKSERDIKVGVANMVQQVGGQMLVSELKRRDLYRQAYMAGLGVTEMPVKGDGRLAQVELRALVGEFFAVVGGTDVAVG
jgi:chromosome partitioning protein